MKVGAGGLQTQAVHDEVANRQVQEARRTDYLHKPVADSENTAALNRKALNKTVEKPHDAGQSFDLPLKLRRRERDNSRGNSSEQPPNEEDRGQPSGVEEKPDPTKEPESRGFKLDQYI